MSIPTPHLQMKSTDDVAKTVLMPGDPLRAKFIAENFLTDPVQVNSIRNCLGYTGTYKNRRISVISSGMGMPSIGIYSYELFKFYDVENIIRIGSCGSYSPDVKLYDVILADAAWSESSFARTQTGYAGDTLEASLELNDQLAGYAAELAIPIRRGCIHSSDVFYREDGFDFRDAHNEHGCIAVEMEAFALFSTAQATGKQASCICTVSDSLVTHERTTSEERQTAFTSMMRIALEMAE